MTTNNANNWALATLALTFLTSLAMQSAAQNADYHRNHKYSPQATITPDNVHRLAPVWQFNTGEPVPEKQSQDLFSFQDQPSLIDGNLIVCSTSRQLFALDPSTGEQRWHYDPEDRRAPIKKCRGIAHWIDHQASTSAFCRSRIILGTADYRLIAIDGATGKPCTGFGENGQITLPTSRATLFTGEVSAMSRPAVINDTIVIGSSVADNQRVAAPSGQVLAFDARSGKATWRFDPIPRSKDDPAITSWPYNTEQFGQGNVWAAMAVDEQLGLIYLPTSSPSSDFYGGQRAGDNHYTSSVVALHANTGEVAWHQQLVHHNIWDYDTPSEPILVDYPHRGKKVPALIQNTKMGLVFVFNRLTGEPLVSIEERPVPQTGAADGEVLSPTQPFPAGMPTLAPQSFGPDDAWGFTPIDRWLCKRKIQSLKHGPIYTPPSEQGTILQPSAGGGTNWGGGAFDHNSDVMVVASNTVPMVVTLLPAQAQTATQINTSEPQIELGGEMVFPVQGSPYHFSIAPLMSPLGAPCSKPPWAVLTALDVVDKKIRWQVPLGDISKLAPIPFGWEAGTPGAGGALVTAGGLVFIGYTLDDTLRAFDLDTGKVLWQADLPAAGTAVPISYQYNGEQYIVIAAGGHSMYGSTLGDAVVAFKLPSEDKTAVKAYP